MHVYGELSGTLTAPASIQGTLSGPQGIQGTLTIPTAAEVTPYEGEYMFTPSDETQIISIEQKMALQDIIINPIPNNYGLVTYDGSTITVS